MQSVSWPQSVKLSGQVRCCALFCLMPLSHTYLDCSKYLNNISQRKILYCKTKICQLLKNKSVYIYFKVIIIYNSLFFYVGVLGHDGPYLPPQEMMPPCSSPENIMSHDEAYMMTSLPPRSMPQYQPHPGDPWWRHAVFNLHSTSILQPPYITEMFHWLTL